MTPVEALSLPTAASSPNGDAPKPRRPQNPHRMRFSGLPRVLRNHSSPEGAAASEYLHGLVERYGIALPPPRALMEPIREAGLAFVDLRRLRADLEGLRARTGGGVRRKEERKLRSEIRKTRVQLLLFERRLEALAARIDRKPTSGADLLALHRAPGAP